jgi:hypothetical protein
MRPLVFPLISATLISLWLPASANAGQGAKIFAAGSDQKTMLFRMSAALNEYTDGSRRFSSEYFDANETPSLKEEAWFQNLDLKSYRVSQQQLNETYEVKVDGEKLQFLVTRNGETEELRRAKPGNLIIGPNLVPFVQSHWRELENDQEVTASLVVPEMKDYFTFQLRKLRVLDGHGEKRIVVQMKPKNFIIAAFVRPIELIVNSDGSRILEIHGRMVPKLKQGSRWVDFEGEAIFSY